MCVYFVGWRRRSNECGQDRICVMGGLVGTIVPIGMGKIVLIGDCRVGINRVGILVHGRLVFGV